MLKRKMQKESEEMKSICKIWDCILKRKMREKKGKNLIQARNSKVNASCIGYSFILI